MELDEDITAPIKDNQTWNDCPVCGKSWKDDISTPGLLHRTRLCDSCAQLSKLKPSQDS